LPAPLSQSLREWAQAAGRVSLRRAILLQVAEPQLLTQLTRERRIREDIRCTLSPRLVEVRADHLPGLLRRLGRRGLVPRLDPPLAETPAAAPLRSGRSAQLRFDQPSLAYLYLSVRLCHQLSDLIPPAQRAPYSLLLDLEAQLAPADRDLAAQLADEAAQRILHPPHSPLPSFLTGEGPGVGALPVAHTLAQVEQALQAGTPLELVYYSPYRDEVTTRVVEPHRIEWRGQTPYLLAYCTLDQDERTFRVDRIRTVTPA
jgi:hypothetical protein